MSKGQQEEGAAPMAEHSNEEIGAAIGSLLNGAAQPLDVIGHTWAESMGTFPQQVIAAIERAERVKAENANEATIKAVAAYNAWTREREQVRGSVYVTAALVDDEVVAKNLTEQLAAWEARNAVPQPAVLSFDRSEGDAAMAAMRQIVGTSVLVPGLLPPGEAWFVNGLDAAWQATRSVRVNKATTQGKAAANTGGKMVALLLKGEKVASSHDAGNLISNYGRKARAAGLAFDSSALRDAFARVTAENAQETAVTVGDYVVTINAA